MTSGTLEQIIAKGNPPERGPRNNKIRCVDGFALSVIAHWGAHCRPRPAIPEVELYFGGDTGISNDPANFPGPYTHVEVGFPSAKPEPWADWEEYCENPGNPTETVYGYVPADMVRSLIASHGGEAEVRP